MLVTSPAIQSLQPAAEMDPRQKSAVHVSQKEGHISKKSKINIDCLPGNKQPKPIFTSTTVASVVATHLKSVKTNKLANKPLRVLIDSGSDESFINQKWTLHGKTKKNLHL